MEVIAAAIGSWSFSAHDFTDDELLYGALLMLKHALQMPELDKWRMSDGKNTQTRRKPLNANTTYRGLGNISLS